MWENWLKTQCFKCESGTQTTLAAAPFPCVSPLLQLRWLPNPSASFESIFQVMKICIFICVCVYIKCRYIPPPMRHFAYIHTFVYVFFSLCVCVCAVTSNLCMYLSVCRRSSSKVHCSAAATPTRRLHVRIVNITKAACGAASFYVYICICVCRCCYACVCV